jgi:hypothetical protein
MNKKIWIIALVLLVFVAIGTAVAQSQSAAGLVNRAVSLAERFERMVERTRTAPSTPRSQNDLRREAERLEDEGDTFARDYTYAIRMGTTFTPDQERRILDATRRIENAGAQIQRNVSRW